MTDTDTIVCPECDSRQPDTAPFCQDCGYRMSSPKTMREPMMALTPERLQAHEKSSRGDARQPAKSEQSKKDTGRRPARQMVGVGAEEAEAADKKASDRFQARQSSHTLVEGMQAISREQPDSVVDDDDAGVDESVEFDSSPEKVPPTTARMSPPIQAGPRGAMIRLVVVGTLLASVAIVAGLSWFHFQRQEAAEQTGPVSSEIDVIDIDAGHFRRGLADDAQSYILEFCYRYYDNPDESCDRDRLFEGEYPEQTVEMGSYSIDSGPVRNIDYQQCVAAGDCDAVAFDDCDAWTPRGLQLGLRVPQILREDEHPVVCVDRSEARTYCQWKEGDLPSHNQWEQAARGRNSYLFPWGDYWESDLANWGEVDVLGTSVAGKLDGYAWTSPPGAFPDGKSPFGLDDMAGNVAEWVNGDDPLSGYVRGGSWLSDPYELRTTARQRMDVSATRTDIGFRCVYP